MEIYCDGSFYPMMREKPGYSSFVAISDGNVIKSMSYMVDVNESMEAEFLAVIYALQWALLKGYQEIEIITDCAPVVTIIQGNSSKSSRYEKYSYIAQYLSLHFKKVDFRWISRNDNKLTDRMCRNMAKVSVVLNSVYSAAASVHSA